MIRLQIATFDLQDCESFALTNENCSRASKQILAKFSLNKTVGSEPSPVQVDADFELVE